MTASNKNASDGIHVCLMHAQALVNSGLLALMSGTQGMTVSYTDIFDVSRRRGAVVITDYPQGLRLAPMAQAAGLKIIVLTDHNRELHVTAALRLGVHGYLLHGCDGVELDAAIRCVKDGGIHVAASLCAKLAAQRMPPLTVRETDTLHLLARGYCNKSIARTLDISEGTVKSYMKTIFQKLQVHCRTHAVVVAAERGLTDLRKQTTNQPGPDVSRLHGRAE